MDGSSSENQPTPEQPSKTPTDASNQYIDDTKRSLDRVITSAVTAGFWSAAAAGSLAVGKPGYALGSAAVVGISTYFVGREAKNLMHGAQVEQNVQNHWEEKADSLLKEKNKQYEE